MKRDMQQELKIIPKPDDISWMQITELLNKAYEIREREGFKFVALNQKVEETINRCSNGVCLVALVDGKLVGTITFIFKTNNLD